MVQPWAEDGLNVGCATVGAPTTFVANHFAPFSTPIVSHLMYIPMGIIIWRFGNITFLYFPMVRNDGSSRSQPPDVAVTSGNWTNSSQSADAIRASHVGSSPARVYECRPFTCEQSSRGWNKRRRCLRNVRLVFQCVLSWKCFFSRNM